MEMNIENELKETIPAEVVEEKSSWVKRLLFEEYSSLSQHAGYVLFLLVLILLYITNEHYYEKNARAINKNLREIRDVEYEYKYLLQEWTIKTKESELEQRMKAYGIESSSTPPYVIQP